MKIFVAGHTGLVGSALVREISNSEEHSWVGRTRSELDLFDLDAIRSFLSEERPDAVIVAAARVGGIGANSTNPVEFLSENLKIELNMMEAAHAHGVTRLVFLGSSCIYPKFATQPIKEEALLTGGLEETNAPYSIAKIAGLKLVEAYRSQFGRDWISAMPCNLYGPGDNFDLQSGHVLPSLIRRFHEAKVSGATAVTLWGSGSPTREFLFADDAAKAILFLLGNYSEPTHVNIGSGDEISIRDLAQTVAQVVGYTGSTFWDHSRPDGTPRKLLDSSKIHKLGWQHSTSLLEGVRKTYDWYLKNQA